ncbi:endo alpha-1,4 polygalactosaminidase [Amycolatopsis sp. PS_44_ISF1]|uniref:endo alpha-1,4 polygalactosaminidase n=1 Tax=Amycolatopsis sp. PS_44_ISF1 TaxID=2974917 RepID=UPI0028DE82ED|nr:endo alpha-1,4 polygalactosaminidase [Amycolatopsis sp. PS_44_ISF1]MDT8915971.1 endo alpha-1,4 polygalactosaminidase [Amycolatopsis sp. PS_44_ISF1]
MPFTRLKFFRCAALVTTVLGSVLTSACAASAAPAVTLPPAGAGFDYQIGGPYEPPAGVEIVSRDHGVAPAPGLYNICYVNAFQSQPRTEAGWGDLLLRDDHGEVVHDPEWEEEALLDIRKDTRQRVAERVEVWIDECAAKGYQAVEPDNFDSFSRSQDLISEDDAQQYIRLLSAHAHAKGLAIAQKNTSEFSGHRTGNGLDFAIAEECGQQKNCDEFTAGFGRQVIVLEYTAKGLANACDRWSELSIVRRDKLVAPKGSSAYLRQTC